MAAVGVVGVAGAAVVGDADDFCDIENLSDISAERRGEPNFEPNDHSERLSPPDVEAAPILLAMLMLLGDEMVNVVPLVGDELPVCSDPVGVRSESELLCESLSRCC